jgi:hypothetical protein
MQKRGPLERGAEVRETEIFEYIALAGVACLIVWTLIGDRRRTTAVRQYARSKEFTILGASLPRSFPFEQTSVKRASSIANAVAGDWGGKGLLFFDCRLGSGKARRTQTVVAIRGPEECFGPARFGPGMTTEAIGEWVLIYRSNRRLPIEEIEALLGSA